MSEMYMSGEYALDLGRMDILNRFNMYKCLLAHLSRQAHKVSL